MKYCYFVSYAHSQGFGNCSVTNNKEIVSIEQLQQLALEIADDANLSAVVILSFQLLLKETE